MAKNRLSSYKVSGARKRSLSSTGLSSYCSHHQGGRGSKTTGLSGVSPRPLRSSGSIVKKGVRGVWHKG